MEHKFIQANITVLLYLIVLYYLKNAAISFVEFPRKLFDCVKVYYVFLIFLTILGFFKRLFILIRIIVSHWLNKMIGVLFFRNGSMRMDPKNFYWKTRSKSLENWKMVAQDHFIDDENRTGSLEQKGGKYVSNKNLDRKSGIREDTAKVKNFYICESKEISSESLRKYRHIKGEDVKWKQMEFITGDDREMNISGTLGRINMVKGTIEKREGEMKERGETEEKNDKREEMKRSIFKNTVKNGFRMSGEEDGEKRDNKNNKNNKNIFKKNDVNNDVYNNDAYNNDVCNNDADNDDDDDDDKTRKNTKGVEDIQFTDCVEEEDLQFIENKIKSLFINNEKNKKYLDITSKTIYSLIKNTEEEIRHRSKYMETGTNLPYSNGNKNVNTNINVTDENSDDILENRKMLMKESLLHEEIRKDLLNAKLFDEVINGVNEKSICKKRMKEFYDVVEGDYKEKEKIKTSEKPLKSILKKKSSQYNNTVKQGEEKEKKAKKCIRFNNDVETHFFEKSSCEDHQFIVDDKQILWKFYESYKLPSVDFFDYYKIKNNFKIALTDFLTPLHTYKNKLVSKF